MSRAPASAALASGTSFAASTNAAAIASTLPRRGLREDRIGERLQPALARDHRARAALRLVRQVQILQLRLRRRPRDPRPQLVGELALPADLLLDGGAPIVELFEIAPPLLDLPDLHLVEVPGRLLPVARDERQRGPLGEERQRLRDLLGTEGELGGDDLGGHASRIVRTELVPRGEVYTSTP